MIYLFSNFQTHSIHYKLREDVLILIAEPHLDVFVIQGYHITWSGYNCGTFDYYISFLHFILNKSKELFNQSSGILPCKTESPFVSTLRPTFLAHL